MFDWLRRLRVKYEPARIEIDADGFSTVAADGERHPMRWDSITKIAAFKRDNFTTNEIVLVIEVAVLHEQRDASPDEHSSNQ
jgi:hypothetical protein